MSTSTERMRRLRARQADRHAELRMVPKPAEDRLLPSVERTLAGLNLGPEDAAVAGLARLLASVMDEMADETFALRRFGPLLLRVLGALHATPMSRAKAGSRR